MNDATCNFDLGSNTAQASLWLDKSFTFQLTMMMYSNNASTRASFNPLSVTRTITLDINTCDKDSCGECDENLIEVSVNSPDSI